MVKFFYILELAKKNISRNEKLYKIAPFLIYFFSIFFRFIGLRIPLEDYFHFFKLIFFALSDSMTNFAFSYFHKSAMTNLTF